MAYDKDKTKSSYYELAPSLQKLIDGKIIKSAVDSMNIKAIALASRLNGITVTIAPTHPTTVQINKNINLTIQVNILEVYQSDGWHKHAVTFK